MQSFRAWFLEQMGMYAAYHRDRRNQATHHVGVPLIVFSLILALMQAPLTHFGSFQITVATVVLAILFFGYVVAAPLVGGVTALFYAVVYALAAQLEGGSSSSVWLIAGASFVGGWIIQFIGHAFEGRRPALTVNAIQIFMAPPFLIAEILFALGTARGLEEQIQLRAVKYQPKEEVA